MTFTIPINTCENYETCGNLVSTMEDYCDTCLAQIKEDKETAEQERVIANTPVTSSVLPF